MPKLLPNKVTGELREHDVVLTVTAGSNATSKTRSVLLDAQWVLPRCGVFRQDPHPPISKMLLNLSRNGMTPTRRVSPSRKVGHRGTDVARGILHT